MEEHVRRRRGELGFTAIGIVLVLGVVAIAIGLAVLAGADAQIRSAFNRQAAQDTDWVIRSAIRMTEDAWREFIGVREDTTTNPPSYTGTVYNAVEIYSREEDFLWAVGALGEGGQTVKSCLLPLFYEHYKQCFDYDTLEDKQKLWGEGSYTFAYQYQVDLRTDSSGKLLDADGDGIIPYDPLSTDPQLNTPVYNRIDGDNRRRFNAIITVSGNGVPNYSSDNVFFVFPVRFSIALTVVNETGSREGGTQRTINGTGSCFFYLYRRSFAEYVMFCNTWTYPVIAGFTYDGPVHCNGEIRFMGNAIFTDLVTSVSQTGDFNGTHVNADSYGSIKPIFSKAYCRGVKEIPPPENLGTIVGGPGEVGGVLQGRSIPTEIGVHLPLANPTDDTDDTLVKGGVYIKGDVKSMKLERGDQQQKYVILQDTTRTPVSKTTTYYRTSDCSGSEYSYERTKTNSFKIVEITDVSGYRYTITCDYSTTPYATTNWKKEFYQYREKVESRYYKSGNNWYMINGYPRITTEPSTPTYVSVEDKTYKGIITINDDPNISQAAFYIEGTLGVHGIPSYKTSGSNPPVPSPGGGYDNPTGFGLSGEVNRDTQITVCAKNDLIISDDITYESYDPAAKNIMGLLSETGNVLVGNSENNDIIVSGAIMAPHGMFQAENYYINSSKGTQGINMSLRGGIVQDGYGAVYSRYNRDFKYDKRLKTQAPPLYPKQSACRMQVENQNNQSTLQLIWSY